MVALSDFAAERTSLACLMLMQKLHMCTTQSHGRIMICRRGLGFRTFTSQTQMSRQKQKCFCVAMLFGRGGAKETFWNNKQLANQT